jgi:hypothetical protein
MRKILVSLLTILTLACSQEITEESQHLEPQFVEGTACPNNTTTVQNVFRHWNCDTNVYLNVQSLTDADRSIIASAAQAWNSFLHSRYPQLPRFTTDPAVSPRNYTITVNKTTAGTTWCGGVSPGGSARPTSLTVGTTGSGNRCGAAFDLALHEMAHIVGFGGDWHTSPTILQHCAVALTTGVVNTVNTNGRPCQWEVETMLAMYGVRPAPASTTKHIITTLFGPFGPTSLQVPNTGTLGYKWYAFNGSNGTLCGKTARQMCEADEGLQSMTGSLNWSSSATNVATVTSPGAQTTVTAVAAGSTTITATPRAITAYDIAVNTRASRNFTVTPPPPPPPNASIVGNYTSSTNTIRSNQTCLFKAFPSGATYSWSRMNAGTTLWKSAGSTQTISLSTGTVSFQLRVVVTNASGSDTATLSLNVTPTGVLCDGF